MTVGNNYEWFNYELSEAFSRSEASNYEGLITRKVNYELSEAFSRSESSNYEWRITI